ncbi:hypothetical protein Tco_1422003, partial [Tanacetum coccineum]
YANVQKTKKTCSNSPLLNIIGQRGGTLTRSSFFNHAFYSVYAGCVSQALPGLISDLRLLLNFGWFPNRDDVLPGCTLWSENETYFRTCVSS